MATRLRAADIEAEIERTRRELDRTLIAITAVLGAAKIFARGYDLVKEVGSDKIGHVLDTFLGRVHHAPHQPPAAAPAPAPSETPTMSQPDQAHRGINIGVGEVLAVGSLLLTLYLNTTRRGRS
jgi:hypothetical protein